MILKELVKCYDLMVDSDKFEIADNNSSAENVSFKFVIGQDGLIKQVLDLRKNNKPVSMLVPYRFSGRQGKAIVPYFLYDNSKYLLGCEFSKKSSDIIEFDEHIDKSKKLHMDVLKNSDSKYKLILERFFNNYKHNRDIVREKKMDVLEGGFIVLSLENEKKFIHEQDEIRRLFRLYRENKFDNTKVVRGTCLIDGETNVPIARTHRGIKKISGSPGSGAILVSFNEDSFKSYGKVQSYNASVSIYNEFKYTTALNKLLSSRDNSLNLSDTTIVFWSDKIGCKEEEFLSAFILEENSKENEVEYNQEGVDEIDSAIRLVRKGMTVDIEKINYDSSINMYILGLSPNNARIFVRFWFKNSIGDFVKLSNRHFEDTKLIRKRNLSKKDSVYEEVGVKIKAVLRSIEIGMKGKKIPKTLIHSLFRSVLTGDVYPESIYKKVLSKVKLGSEEVKKEDLKKLNEFELEEKIDKKSTRRSTINHTRVSFIKGYLKRYYRRKNLINKEEEVTVSLNTTSTNVAYNLGRIFALLEKIQINSNKSSNIREKYFSSASSTPKSIFPNLLNLAQYHIAKIKKDGENKYKNYDNMIGEILLNIDEFPAVFSSDEQGMFILGYYHQRQDIYTSKKNEEEN